MRIFVSLILVLLGLQAIGQVNPDLLRESPKDTVTKSDMNMDAVYSRPFLALGKSQTSIGGYIEADYNYIGEDGVTDGHSFRIPRMTLFVASTIKRRLKFLSEIELEEGGKEIAIEFAAVDFEIHPLLNLRGGVVMNPIGAFNQNHDGPKWEFVERPAAMTEMLAATWSNVGFGIYGKRYKEDWSFGYELYLTNGFDDSIIGNQENKTFLPASKANSERFEENSNGMPLFTGKAAIKHSKIAEIGLSYMTGVYNKFENDGLVVDQKRSVRTIAIDFNSTIRGIGTYVVGEWA